MCLWEWETQYQEQHLPFLVTVYNDKQNSFLLSQHVALSPGSMYFGTLHLSAFWGEF